MKWNEKELFFFPLLRGYRLCPAPSCSSTVERWIAERLWWQLQEIVWILFSGGVPWRLSGKWSSDTKQKQIYYDKQTQMCFPTWQIAQAQSGRRGTKLLQVCKLFMSIKLLMRESIGDRYYHYLSTTRPTFGRAQMLLIHICWHVNW